MTRKRRAEWSNDFVEQLQELQREGLPKAEIARRLGGGHTRNSVVGKLRRLRGESQAKRA